MLRAGTTRLRRVPAPRMLPVPRRVHSPNLGLEVRPPSGVSALRAMVCGDRKSNRAVRMAHDPLSDHASRVIQVLVDDKLRFALDCF